MDGDRAWRFYSGYRVRRSGHLFTVNRYGEVRRRSVRRPIRWLHVTQIEAMSVRLMATKAFPGDDRTKWGVPHEDRHHE